MNTQSFNDTNHHQSLFHSNSASFSSSMMDPTIYFGDTKPMVNVEGDKTGIFQFNHNIQGPFESVHFPTPKKRDTADATIAAKKMKRTLANRRSARESYLRRKARFADQTALVTTLMKQNSAIRAENSNLRLEIEALKKQLRSGACSGLLPKFRGA